MLPLTPIGVKAVSNIIRKYTVLATCLNYLLFQKIREPFLEAVKITLGDRYTENMESIYKIAITFILQTMADGMQDAMKEESLDKEAS